MTQHIIAPHRIDPAWLITPASFLMDRIQPDCEQIWLAGTEVEGGTLDITRGPLPAPVRSRRRLPRQRSGPPALPHANVFDLRRNDPENWAHFLNNHLPIVFRACDTLGLNPADCLLVLPGDTPGYIQRAARMFGLPFVATDATLDGDGILYDPMPWTAIRAQRANWVQTGFVRDTLARIDADTATADLPRRVFLSRRKTRALTNEAEVAAWLGARGFVTVYPEDMSPEDQMRLFRRAETMVAVHGAGLAPLLYCQPGAGPSHLVEILHAGHMTNVFRAIAAQVGCNWIGVRGRLKPKYIKPAYDLKTPFRKYSLDTFEADITALERAFEVAKMA